MIKTLLKDLLAHKKISMYELAKRTGLGQGTINEIVNNKRKAIKLGTAVKISEVLGVSAEELYISMKEGK